LLLILFRNIPNGEIYGKQNLEPKTGRNFGDQLFCAAFTGVFLAFQRILMRAVLRLKQPEKNCENALQQAFFQPKIK
jgi:hypothetical protein